MAYKGQNQKNRGNDRGSGPKVVTRRRKHARSGAVRVTGATTYLIYGRHAVLAALGNPLRQVVEIIGTESALEFLAGAAPLKPDFATNPACRR